MSRKTVRLTLDGLGELPQAQRSCLFWQASPVDRARMGAEEQAAEKEAWVSTLLREWGSCGRLVEVDGVPVGVAIYAPQAWLPGQAILPTSPASPDSVLLADFWVHPDHRGGGLGRLLVQGVARDLTERGHTAVETYGQARGRGLDGCVVPVEFWGSVGFKTQRAHPSTPRMRMDLRTSVSWKSEVERALERLWGVVRPTKQKATRPIGGSARVAPDGDR